MAVELKNKIEIDLRVDIPISYFLEETTVTDLSKRIHQLFEDGNENELKNGMDKMGLDAEKAKMLLENLDQLSEEQVSSLLDDLLNEED